MPLKRLPAFPFHFHRSRLFTAADAKARNPSDRTNPVASVEASAAIRWVRSRLCYVHDLVGDHGFAVRCYRAEPAGSPISSPRRPPARGSGERLAQLIRVMIYRVCPRVPLGFVGSDLVWRRNYSSHCPNNWCIACSLHLATKCSISLGGWNGLACVEISFMSLDWMWIGDSLMN
jgi:hypothetical protein